MFHNFELQPKLLRQATRGARQSERLARRSDFAQVPESSPTALNISRNLRGEDRPPAILLHGVMPRSGTVFVGELIRLHPRIHAYANDLWELPFLELSGEMHVLQRHFFDRFRYNADKMSELDLLTLFGGALMGYLHSFVPPGKRLMMKVPEAKGLAYFSRVFPHETALLLMRDGRDVVSSSLKTWPRKRFSHVASEWDRNARLMLEYEAAHHNDSLKPVTLGIFRYEDILAEPDAFIRDLCKRSDLPVDEYPFHAIDSIPSRGSSSTRKRGQVTWQPRDKKPDYSPTGHWRSWTRRDLNRFYKIAGETLNAAGYYRD